MLKIFKTEYVKNIFIKNGLIPMFDEYKNSREKLKALDKNGYYVYTNLENLRANKHPKEFHKSNPYTLENIKTYIENNRNGFRILSDSYNGNKEMLCFKCNQNHIFKMSWDNFRKGNGCRYCYGRIKKTHDDFVFEMFSKYGKEYSVIGKYKTTNDKIEIKHNICNKTSYVRPYSILGGRRCRYCYGTHTKSHDHFKEEVYSLVGDEYSVIGEYINCKTKVKMVHNVCGYEYDVISNSFLSGSRCGKCRESKGEYIISKYLKNNNYLFEREFKIKDCKYLDVLRFDFAVFKDNGEMILIEFDGIQHYKPVEIFGGVDGYNLALKRDNVKNKYCEKNNLNLLRIPYYKIEKIEEILDAYLGI